MKKLLLTMFSLILGTTFLMSQSVKESSSLMSLGKQNAYILEINDVKQDMVKDIWEDMIDDHYDGDVKRNKKANEYFTEKVRIPMISGAEVALYAKFEERIGITYAYLWTDLGGSFVGSNNHPNEAKGVEDFLHKFYVAVKKKAYDESMEDEKDKLDDMKDDMKDLEDKNKDYLEDIEKAKEKIRETEIEIEKNLQDQETQRMVIKKQEDIIDKLINLINNLGI